MKKPKKVRVKGKPDLRPQSINKFTWYYENSNSITVVREIFNFDGKYFRTEQFKIPLSMLFKTIKRLGYRPATLTREKE